MVSSKLLAAVTICDSEAFVGILKQMCIQKRALWGYRSNEPGKNLSGLIRYDRRLAVPPNNATDPN
jgi:hypothetical protein